MKERKERKGMVYIVREEVGEGAQEPGWKR